MRLADVWPFKEVRNPMGGAFECQGEIAKWYLLRKRSSLKIARPERRKSLFAPRNAAICR